MRRAIELAELGRGHTRPNPLVGAVIARDDRVLGEGYHVAYGGAHAEVAAISACEDDPIGATMYVTLEPCCHRGQTPPCTEAIVRAGISRVVVASDDPTGKASGRGLGILRDEGVDVTLVDGDVSHSARLLNQPFRKHARTGRPLVTFKSAMSLDGHVATQTGDSKWISGEQSRDMVHGWRAHSDAICVGIGTALALFSVVKRQQEGFALGFVTSRVFEAAMIGIGIVSLLGVVALRQPGATGVEATSLTTVGSALAPGPLQVGGIDNPLSLRLPHPIVDIAGGIDVVSGLALFGLTAAAVVVRYRHGTPLEPAIVPPGEMAA